MTCLIAMAAACGEIGEAETSETLSRQSPLFFEPGEGTLWNGATSSNPGPLGTGAVIPVCFSVRPHVEPNGTVKCPFQNSANVDCSGNTTDFGRGVSLNVPLVRQKIRTAIERTWVRHANVSFTGWDDCPIGADGRHTETDPSLRGKIMIVLQQLFDPPANLACTTHEFCRSRTTNAYCNEGFCAAGAVDLTNITGRSAQKATVVQLSWSYLLQPVPGTAGVGGTIHEMGHALGFQHEWRRSDYSDSRCTARDVRTVSGGLLLSDFPDLSSVMNYCGVQRPDDGTISEGDVLGVQRAYGRKSKGSLVSGEGMCANISGGVATIGAPIIAFPCNNQANDRWFRDNVSSRYQATPQGTARCLNVSGGAVSPTTPTPVGSWSCDAGDNEKFPLTDMEWRAMGNMCVTATGTASGARLNVQPCGLANQRWSFFDGDPATSQRFEQIRLMGTNLCVSAGSDFGALGERLSLRPCSTTDLKQRFGYPGTGVISFRLWCMNVSGGLPTPGAALVLWDGCNANPGLPNEVFNLTGSIKTVFLPRVGGGSPFLSQCLDGSNRSQVSVATCNSSNINQTWDYYF